MEFKINNYNSKLQDVNDDTDFIQLSSEFLSKYNDTEKRVIENKVVENKVVEKKVTENEKQNINLKKTPSNKKYKNVNCVNCGEKGHVVKDCDGPITSFGILAFKVVNNPLDEIGDKNKELEEIIKSIKTTDDDKKRQKIKFLMIQRKDTMGYIDFIRGKYPDDKVEKNKLIKILLNEMTEKEKGNLKDKTFDTIWKELWLNHDSKCFKNEYELAKKKYESLDIIELAKSPSTFNFQEFGFPKGRRNMKETNIACAEREFYEETGYDKNSYVFIKNYPTIHEEFVGTNGVQYRHIYYLVKMKDDITAPRIDHSNIVQTGEVQNIGWFTYDECMALIRPYDIAKKDMIKKVYNDLVEMNDNYSCSNFYYNTRKQNYVSSYVYQDYKRQYFSRN